MTSQSTTPYAPRHTRQNCSAVRSRCADAFLMQKPFMRIPYTGQLPPPVIIPRSANTPVGAVAALADFLAGGAQWPGPRHGQTVLLTGAGISVSSGLADYRGTAGTYRVNKTYRPIYYSEFIANHEARKRYWARSFLGWPVLLKAKPNKGHQAVRELGHLGIVKSVITQNVDSFHPQCHPGLHTLELHGYLRALVCLSCRNHLSRESFQESLATLNPAWDLFLQEMLTTGALDTEHPEERRRRGLKTNPDGDVDVPNAPYSTFRYPPCPVCATQPPKLKDGTAGKVEVDEHGAWLPSSTAGVLKPAVVMFGESISSQVKEAAEHAVDDADNMLVVGSSLATYSAWRLVKRAKERGMPIGILNLGGIRGEDELRERLVVRCDQSSDRILPDVVERLKQRIPKQVHSLGHRVISEAA